jgi:hypothetical protein
MNPWATSKWSRELRACFHNYNCGWQMGCFFKVGPTGCRTSMLSKSPRYTVALLVNVTAVATSRVKYWSPFITIYVILDTSYRWFWSPFITIYLILYIGYRWSSCTNAVTGPFLLNLARHFRPRLQNCEKRLLAPLFLYVRPSAWNNWSHTGWIFIKCDTWSFFETLSKKIKFY